MKSKGTILVVEDREDWQNLARSALKSKGYEVLSAFCATLAMQIYREHKVSGGLDLIITDMGLLGMDGAELIKILRQKEGFKGPIAIVCGRPPYEPLMKELGVFAWECKSSDCYKKVLDAYEKMRGNK